MESASKKTHKIYFKPAQACVFMLQGIKLGDSEMLVGSSLDCWLFLFDLTGEAYSDEPIACLRTDNYPINNASYCASNNTLVGGTVGGALYLFRNFSKAFFRDVRVFNSCAEPLFNKFAICTYWQDQHLWSINYPSNVYKVDPSRHAEGELVHPSCILKDKIANAIFFNTVSGSGPHIAVNFIIKMGNKPPALFSTMDEYNPTIRLSLDDAQEDMALSTCMAYSQRTNEIVVGNYHGEVLLYSIVENGGRYFCDLKLAYNFSDEKLVLAVQCDNQNMYMVNLVKIKWADLDSVVRKGSKKHPSSLESVSNLMTMVGDRRLALGNKTLKIVKGAVETKTCAFRVLDIPQEASEN